MEEHDDDEYSEKVGNCCMVIAFCSVVLLGAVIYKVTLMVMGWKR